MQACSCRSILLPAVGIIAIGTAIGIVDAFARPITLTREPPPALELPKPKPPADGTNPAGTPPSATPATPSSQSPGPKATPTQPTAPKPVTPAPVTPAPTAAAADGCTPTPKDKLPVGHITMDDAKALFDGGAVTFVDTRKDDIYEAGHVQGAYRISLHDFENGDPQILNFIDRASVVVTYCVGGNCDESEAVAKQLTGAGYKKVYVMHDGFPCWKGLGFPVETGKGMFP